MTDRSRLQCTALADTVMSAEEAAAFIAPGDHVGMSGFTGAGYPKAVPAALVRRVTDATARGDRFTVSVWTGASTAPELDGALAAAGGIDLRMPYQSDPVSRAKINADHCAHPGYRPALQDYLDRATASASGKHTPHLLSAALSWHLRYLQNGTMRPV
jgi:acyl-CoA hydrolase